MCTVALEPAGYPYGSFVTFALHEGKPVFLISRIAEHTRNVANDPRASLLVHELGKPDPLANGRVTLIGQCRKLAAGDADTSAARASFLATHANASYYVDYADFDFWQLEIEAVRYIGGYGRMSWLDVEAFVRATPDPLAPSADRILKHMNDDHAGSLLLYARKLTLATDAERAVMTAIDRYGFEMTVHTPRGIGPARVAFMAPLTTAQDARVALVELARQVGDPGAH